MLNKTKRTFLSNTMRFCFSLYLLLGVQTILVADDLEHEVSGGAALIDYSKGMQAYMHGDFERSQIHWLNAAKQNDAKSMFNLGLLHEQAKISDANIEKAENWYRLAGKHGYAAADFHLAKLIMADAESGNTNKEAAIVLLQRAADQGFFPAQQMLAEQFAGSLSPFANQSNTKIGLSSVSRNSDVERIENSYLSEDWIANKQPSDWTIQILAFEDKAKVQEFIDRHQLNTVASYFVERAQDKVLYKLIYGSYQSKQEAESARDNLSIELKEHGPWLRTIASVQSLLNTN